VKIPEDVMANAMRALMVPEHEMVDSVARAILAERNRCADVARREGDKTDPAVGYLISKAIEAGA
jgi:hypothetical protein